ncbi:MAG: class C sortase [Bifidobacterium tibiigranuli]|jgi:sortase A|uniref:class C sortase n=1 Tax=Bifidobacterium tibiigranuli TaxID=2172043 RepID=UPI0023531155|nr:class C sortase [Bifidobacterium tibiigranuli]MCH3975582.1 class C sortase [Bifidobacterium tibiigranuli]MCH4189537.1 class C sortase [Bifidobacterium tibiigranuli]MCH4204483.1 class C sortase [Bifidobacterium tibiigranuli]MCH4275132.1 class C sortase [Bifidobacterium tibiigranuli]MCI1791804.1 class C sortase [Bifidobacterium tibiigranuli]
MFTRHNDTEANPRHRSSAAAVTPAEAASTANAGGNKSARPKWRLRLYALIPALLVLAGLGVLMYPTAADWFSQYDQSRLIDDSTQQIKSGKLEPSIVQQLKDAHEYNDALSSGAVLEANHRIPTGSGTSQDPNESLDYNNILVTPSGVMARLRVPSIDVDLPIYHGTSDATLLKGVGHLEGTSLPVGGEGTHAVLTGHRGLATATMFTNLNKVKKGDTFTIEVLDQVLSYKVFDIRVVDPSDTAALKADPKKDLVTLVTCTPLGINSQRILVTGERIYPTPKADIAAARKPSTLPRFPWWIVVLAGGFIGATAFVWRSGYPPKAKKPRGSGGDNDAEDSKGVEGSDGLEENAAPEA